MVSFYRTCRYKNEGYIFHCFEQYSNVVGESIAIGGHSAIKFTDDKYLDYNC